MAIEPREVEQLRLAAMGERDVPTRNGLQVVCRYITEQAGQIERPQTRLKEVIDETHAAEDAFAEQAAENERLREGRDTATRMMRVRDGRITSLESDNERLREIINHSGAIQRKMNRDVLVALGESCSTNPDEFYIPPVTLARRAKRAEQENTRTS